MKRRHFLKTAAIATPALATAAQAQPADLGAPHPFGELAAKPSAGEYDTDLVILQATPAGTMAARVAGQQGLRVTILERTAHIGGLPANGLGATDIGTRGATGGLFMEFVTRVKAYYVDKYGPDSEQVKKCSDGYHFEPSVAEKIFEQMLAEVPAVKVLRRRQFEAAPESLGMRPYGKGQVADTIVVTNLETNATEVLRARYFIDASYEGDLIAAAGIPYVVGREAASQYNEPGAGRVYKLWGGQEGPGSTGYADNAVQAYNYRMCLTDDPKDRVPVPKPARYNREEYVLLAKGVNEVWFAAKEYANASEAKRKEWIDTVKKGALPKDLPWIMTQAYGWVVNLIKLPNGKSDSNNQHNAFLSTDLPEENWPWPTSSWAWRDAFAQRLRDYTLGLLYFAQNDASLPAFFRKDMQRWGLAKSEYADNGHFPRQVYVREGRRMQGAHFFIASDAQPAKPGERPKVYRDSITASHYALDSHAVRKYEPGRVHLDGFLSYHTQPYTVPYGVMVPKAVGNVLAPVPVSGSHIGFSTLRMEPCWMALGEAAGMACVQAAILDVPVQAVNLQMLQVDLLSRKAVLFYYKDCGPADEHYPVLALLGLAGHITGWNAEPTKTVDKAEADEWIKLLQLWMKGKTLPTSFQPGTTTRAQLAAEIWKANE